VDDAHKQRQNAAIMYAAVVDPHQCQTGNVTSAKLLAIFNFKFTDDPIWATAFSVSFKAYLQETTVFNVRLDLDQLWRGRLQTTPQLAMFALCVIWLPTSNCDVERFFSSYNRVLDEERMSITQETLVQMMPIYTNTINVAEGVAERMAEGD
jgi:hypothetical protein